MSTARAPFLGACLAAAACLPASAWAHAFDRRYDLPAPLSYFVFGATAVVGLSLVVAVLFARKAPQASLAAGAITFQVPGLGALRAISRIFAILVLGLVLVAGFLGEGDPMTNIVPTLTWIIGWVGLSLAVACVGNVWPAFDPWRGLFDWLDALVRRWGNGTGIRPCWTYPKGVGQWPAVALLLSIAWFELVYSQAAIPFHIASVALAWSGVTLLGMACFGRETWQRNVDVFAVYFDVLGRFAPLGAGPGKGGIELRAPGRGLITAEKTSTATTAFIVAMLSTVLFDGLLNGQFWRLIMREVGQAAPELVDGYALTTAGLLGLWLVFLGAYALSCQIAATLVSNRPVKAVMSLFALTLVPIAVAYNIAHNFSMLVAQGQDLVRLLSDPLGLGWNLFGTADLEPAIGIIDARATWYIAIAAIVSGHVISVWLAHRAALREFSTPRRAVIASVPLTALMMVYTVISLSVIAEPMVKFDFTRQLSEVPVQQQFTR